MVVQMEHMLRIEMFTMLLQAFLPSMLMGEYLLP